MNEQNQESVNALGAFKVSLQAQVDALTLAMTIIQNGWQSDQDAIAAGIQSGIDTSVKTATDPLNAQITAMLAALASIYAANPVDVSQEIVDAFGLANPS